MFRIESLEIAYLRAFGRGQIITFAQPDSRIPGTGLTVIVGPNNTGKSTLIRTLRELAAEHTTFIAGIDDRRSNEPVRLRLSGTLDQNPFQITVNGRGHSAHLTKVGLDSRINGKIRYIPSRRPWNDRFHPNSGGFDGGNHDAFLYNNLRTSDFYVDTEFGRLLKSIETDNDRKQAYSSLLREIEPTIKDWTIDNNGVDFISFLSTSGNRHRVGLVGDGVNNLFRITASIFELDQDEVLLLDEPELSLHPQTQKRLYKALRQRAACAQIVVSTHSSYFISWEDIQAGARVYRANLIKEDGALLLQPKQITIKGISSVAEEKKNAKLYDIVAKELFFSNGCLFVEGQEDAHIISFYVKENRMPDIEIFGYGSGGASNIINWLRLANDLKIRACGLYDGDEEGTRHYNRAITEFSNNQIIRVKKLPTMDIRDKYECDRLIVEGMFDHKWNIKSDYKDAWHKLLHEISLFLDPEDYIMTNLTSDLPDGEITNP